MVLAKVESFRRSVVYQIDTEQGVAMRTYAEEDSADMITDPDNPIHWLPRARRVRGGIIYPAIDGRFYKEIRRDTPLGYEPQRFVTRPRDVARYVPAGL